MQRKGSQARPSHARLGLRTIALPCGCPSRRPGVHSQPWGQGLRFLPGWASTCGRQRAILQSMVSPAAFWEKVQQRWPGEGMKWTNSSQRYPHFLLRDNEAQMTHLSGRAVVGGSWQELRVFVGARNLQGKAQIQ